MSFWTLLNDIRNALLTGVPVEAPPIEFEVARTGLFDGKAASIVHIPGKRTRGFNSTSVLQDIAGYLDTSQDALNAVSTGTTYYIRSSSAADTAAGTGARTVRIVSLSSTGVQQVTTATLNGTTAVSLGSGFLYFQWMEVATAGSGNVAAGNITIASVTGAPTTAQIVEWITAGGNRSVSGRYMVPLGTTAYLIDWSATAVGGATQDVRFRAKVFADDRTLSADLHFQGTFFLSNATSETREMNYLKFPALCELKVSTIPSATGATNRIDINFGLIVVAD